jgi:3-oxoacyl-[acyl-carrier protein] reductase
MKMEKELTGKVALVTGASRGLGKAIALKLASMGANIAVNYVSKKEEAENVVETIRTAGVEAVSIKADVSSTSEVKNMVNEITAKWQKIDILVNNAGITRDNLMPRMSDDAWDSVINTHLRGAYLCTKFSLRTMMNQSWGRIINIVSVAGLIGNQGQANYSAAKGGLIAFTKSLAKELGSLNITANAIAPGFILTEMTASLPQEYKDAALSRISLKRFGTAEEVSDLVAFLVSNRAGYITGQIISIDGGIN